MFGVIANLPARRDGGSGSRIPVFDVRSASRSIIGRPTGETTRRRGTFLPDEWADPRVISKITKDVTGTRPRFANDCVRRAYGQMLRGIRRRSRTAMRVIRLSH